jgi:hypothetical protein
MGSVYRTIDGTSPNQFSTKPRAEKSEVELRGEAAREEVEKKKRGKAEPTNLVLPRTKEWVATLPADVQPHELMRTFGRIANLLAASWNDPQATVKCFCNLLTDSRGRNRKGFPPKVKAELVVLQSYFVSQTVGGVLLGDELRMMSKRR